MSVEIGKVVVIYDLRKVLSKGPIRRRVLEKIDDDGDPYWQEPGDFTLLRSKDVGVDRADAVTKSRQILKNRVESVRRQLDKLETKYADPDWPYL